MGIIGFIISGIIFIIAGFQSGDLLSINRKRDLDLSLRNLDGAGAFKAEGQQG